LDDVDVMAADVKDEENKIKYHHDILLLHISEFKNLQQKADGYIDLAKRIQAEFIDYQNRVNKNQEDAVRHTLRDFAIEMLLLLDSLKQFIKFYSSNKNFNEVVEGMKFLERDFLHLLEKKGVKPMVIKKGEVFNPHYCEAVEVVETNDIPEGHILEELQMGYTINGQLLRPAKVVVSKKVDKLKKCDNKEGK